MRVELEKLRNKMRVIKDQLRILTLKKRTGAKAETRVTAPD